MGVLHLMRLLAVETQGETLARSDQRALDPNFKISCIQPSTAIQATRLAGPLT